MGDMEMTTLIVVAIVALVFFITISVAAFMVWKYETEKHTESLRGIEGGLNDVLRELYCGNVERRVFTEEEFYGEPEIKPSYKYGGSKVKKEPEKPKRKKDPFKWMRSNNDDDDVIVFKPNKKHVDKLYWTEVDAGTIEKDMPVDNSTLEINHDNVFCGEEETQNRGADFSTLDILEDMEFFGELQKKETDYDVGRSGKKYTAEELEELIKE